MRGGVVRRIGKGNMPPPQRGHAMKHANPYLNFDGNAREAFDHYRSVFGGEFATAMTFREFGGEQMGLSGAMLDRIAHIALPLGSSMLMASDVTRPDDFKIVTNTQIGRATGRERVCQYV